MGPRINDPSLPPPIRDLLNSASDIVEGLTKDQAQPSMEDDHQETAKTADALKKQGTEMKGYQDMAGQIAQRTILDALGFKNIGSQIPGSELQADKLSELSAAFRSRKIDVMDLANIIENALGEDPGKILKAAEYIALKMPEDKEFKEAFQQALGIVIQKVTQKENMQAEVLTNLKHAQMELLKGLTRNL